MKGLLRRVKHLLPAAVIRRYERELHKETHINRALRRAGGATTYVEIGVRDGECIRQIRAAHRIAIDPAPVNLRSSNWNGVDVRAVTSDQFFELQAAAAFKGRRINVALADGLHEFRQTLRDVLNLERYMARDGVIFIHDCNPPTRRHQDDVHFTWNGDVWKVAYYLQRHRPDLSFSTLDCDWGLGMVSGFSQSPPKPGSVEVEAVARLDYDILAADRETILNLRSPLLGSFLIP